MSSWNYYDNDGFELWDYLGFEYGGSRHMAPLDIHFWDTTHNIFNFPIDFGANSMITTTNWGGYSCSDLNPHSNGTSIAGISVTIDEVNKAAIIIGAGGRAITNSMIISEYDGDTDDSTYLDNYELWLNEIAYMTLQPKAPTITSAGDTINTTEFNLAWTNMGEFIDSYSIYLDGVKNETTTGTSYLVKFSGPGTYELQVTSTNPYGESAKSGKITITVEEEATTTTTDTSTSTGPLSDVNTTGILDFFTNSDNWPLIGGIAGGAILLIVIIAVVAKKKK